MLPPAPQFLQGPQVLLVLLVPHCLLGPTGWSTGSTGSTGSTCSTGYRGWPGSLGAGKLVGWKASGAGKLVGWKASGAGKLVGWRATWVGWKANGWLESHLVGWRATGVGWKANGWLESHLVGWRATKVGWKANGWLESHLFGWRATWLAGEPLGVCLRLPWLQLRCSVFIGIRATCSSVRTSSLGPWWTGLVDREFEMLVTMIASHSHLGSVPSVCMSLLTFFLGLNATATEIHLF